MRKILLALALSVNLFGTAQAAGAAAENTYTEACAKDKDQAVCDKALLAAIKRAENIKIDDKKMVCTPKGVSAPESLVVVKTFMGANPQYAHLKVDTVVRGALLLAFPCN